MGPHKTTGTVGCVVGQLGRLGLSCAAGAFDNEEGEMARMPGQSVEEGGEVESNEQEPNCLRTLSRQSKAVSVP